MAEPVGIGVSKLESRWIAVLTAIALGFGGWWLQNQNDMAMKSQKAVEEFQRFVDMHYVDRDEWAALNARLDRLDARIDALRNAEIEERVRDGGGK